MKIMENLNDFRIENPSISTVLVNLHRTCKPALVGMEAHSFHRGPAQLWVAGVEFDRVARGDVVRPAPELGEPLAREQPIFFSGTTHFFERSSPLSSGTAQFFLTGTAHDLLTAHFFGRNSAHFNDSTLFSGATNFV